MAYNSSMARQSKYKVLVVEDEPDFVRLIQYTFQKEGFKVFSAGEAEGGLALARSLKPDLIILDVMLPGMDGMEFCRLLRKETQVPIMFLTAKKSDRDKRTCEEIGANAYVTKPTSVREILDRAKALLECGLPSSSR